MQFSIKAFMLTLAIIGGTSIVTACTTREVGAAAVGAGAGYIVGKEVD